MLAAQETVLGAKAVARPTDVALIPTLNKSVKNTPSKKNNALTVNSMTVMPL
jgi:hypothetical protein